MSLVENIARRQQSPVELLGEISNLKTRGYTIAEIAAKIDVAESYVSGVSRLLERGEERLLAAVEKNKIPLSVAMQIAESDEEGIQRVLCEAYEDKTLRGRKLLEFRPRLRILRSRNRRGDRVAPRGRNILPPAGPARRAARRGDRGPGALQARRRRSRRGWTGSRGRA